MRNTMQQLMKSTALTLGLLAVLAVAVRGFAAKEPSSVPVNINTASAEDLMALPGIGATKAQAIIAYRTNAPFRTVEELANVKGIGDKLLAKITPYVTVSGKQENAQPGTAGKVGH